MQVKKLFTGSWSNGLKTFNKHKNAKITITAEIPEMLYPMWVEGGLWILCWTTGDLRVKKRLRTTVPALLLMKESQNLPYSIKHVDHAAGVGVQLGLQLGRLHKMQHQCGGTLQTELPFSGTAAWPDLHLSLGTRHNTGPASGLCKKKKKNYGIQPISLRKPQKGLFRESTKYAPLCVGNLIAI